MRLMYIVYVSNFMRQIQMPSLRDIQHMLSLPIAFAATLLWTAGIVLTVARGLSWTSLDGRNFISAALIASAVLLMVAFAKAARKATTAELAKVHKASAESASQFWVNLQVGLILCSLVVTFIAGLVFLTVAPSSDVPLFPSPQSHPPGWLCCLCSLFSSSPASP
jgi:hypothetical protein